ncbi:MAG: hypothetical protein ACE5H4_04820 [Candidatus Thorarchaeota archaeon]
MRFEDAVGKVLGAIKLNEPLTVNKIADESGVMWPTAERIIDLTLEIQDFLAANEILVIGSRPKKLVLIEARVEMTRLSGEVLDWFIESAYFTTPRREYSTEEARKIIAPRKETRTPFHEAIIRVVRALELEDQLSILELSKRCDLNRRTVERVLSLLLLHQDTISKSQFVKEKDFIIRQPLPSLYELDSARMMYLLKRRYIPDEAAKIPKERERELLSLP